MNKAQKGPVSFPDSHSVLVIFLKNAIPKALGAGAAKCKTP
jgi:hypothetical protein